MQLHLYLPDELAEEVRRRAEGRGMSVSRYLAEIVRREVGRGWPDGFFEAVVGGWSGEPLERPPQGAPDQRDDL